MVLAPSFLGLGIRVKPWLTHVWAFNRPQIGPIALECPWTICSHTFIYYRILLIKLVTIVYNFFFQIKVDKILL